MRATNRNDLFNMPMAVDSPGLQQLLGCGRGTAEAISSAAGASMKIGGRRLHNVKKVQEYLDRISGSQEAK